MISMLRRKTAFCMSQYKLARYGFATYAQRSQLWIPTEKENPADATIPSHQLLIRGGFIRKSGHGTYAFLPLGKRVLSKLEMIIDQEMSTIHGNKIDLPLMIGADLWQRSGRWQQRGPELIAFTDRRNEIQTLAPTHEESVTNLVATHYQQQHRSSLRLYQVGKKFRDEVRPRFGLLRAREFIMKDMYSFDINLDQSMITYQDVVGAYTTILRDRLALPIAKVEADSGAIGGQLSHEFHVLADIGEDGLLSCTSTTCDYAANVEKAHGVIPQKNLSDTLLCAMEIESDTNEPIWSKLVQGLSNNQGGTVTCQWMTPVPSAESNHDDLSTLALVLVHSDRQVNDLLLKPFYDGNELHTVVPSIHDVENATLQVFVDDSLESHPLTSILQENAKKHSTPLHLGHFRSAQAGDYCPKCKAHELEAKRGIEVGHVFYLGQKYSKPFNASFVDSSGHSQVLEMGCFGMGVSRLIAAIVESSHDEHGIIWPHAIAPYHVVVLSIGGKKQSDDKVAVAAQALANSLSSSSKLDVVLDDRWDERPGSKLTEAELLGYPYRIVVGKRYVSEGLVEILTRATMEKVFLPPEHVLTYIESK